MEASTALVVKEELKTTNRQSGVGGGALAPRLWLGNTGTGALSLPTIHKIVFTLMILVDD